MKDTGKSLSTEAKSSLRIFNKVLPWKLKVQEINQQLGSTEIETCLDVGATNGAISYYLRKRGGNWHTVVTNDTALKSVNRVVTENVQIMKDGNLPFKKNTFDIVVVVDFLEITSSDESFIEDCHRVLKQNGRLLINVSRTKRFSLINPLRRLLGFVSGLDGDVYMGYSEAELFTLLKHGFDVHSIRTYGRFFLEFVDTIVRFFAMRIETNCGENTQEILRRQMRLYSVAKAFYWVAFQMDLLIFLTKGHHFMASAKRRAWRSRNAPVLIDGRTISEAVLSPLK